MLDEHKADWNDELSRMREQLRYALNNIDSIRYRHEVRGRLENVYFTLDELCEQTKGEAS
jgi:hypothetical protein